MFLGPNTRVRGRLSLMALVLLSNLSKWPTKMSPWQNYEWPRSFLRSDPRILGYQPASFPGIRRHNFLHFLRDWKALRGEYLCQKTCKGLLVPLLLQPRKWKVQWHIYQGLYHQCRMSQGTFKAAWNFILEGFKYKIIMSKKWGGGVDEWS